MTALTSGLLETLWKELSKPGPGALLRMSLPVQERQKLTFRELLNAEDGRPLKRERSPCNSSKYPSAFITPRGGNT